MTYLGPLADHLTAALRKHYPKERGWVLLPQVRDGTGAGAGRTADALAFNAWPSRGLELHGFEVKIARSDWLRELKQPEKAESIFTYCDRWWLVTPDAPISREGELPPTWGHLVVDLEKGASVLVDAPKLDPRPLDRTFVAAVLRALEGCAAPEGQIAAAVEAARKEAFESGKSWQRRWYENRSHVQRARYDLDSLLYLEKSAEDVLKMLRRSLKEIREGMPALETEAAEADV